MGSIDLRTAAEQALEFIRVMNMHGWMLADYEGDMERTVAGLEAALAEPDVPCSTCVSLARAVMMDQMGRA